MADPIRVNNVFCWGSIVVKIAGDTYLGYQEVSYDDARERKLVYGATRDQGPMGKTLGKYTPSAGKIKGFLHSIQLLRDALAAKDPEGGASYGNFPFDVLITMTESDLGTNTVELLRCHVTKDASSRAEGSDEAQDEIEFLPEEIWRNGKTLRNTAGLQR